MIRNNFLVIVPARSGSKRLPGKNLARLGNKTLLEWTVDFLNAENALANSILSTDSEEYAAEGRRLGLGIPFIRPKKLSADDTATVDVVVHALDNVGTHNSSSHLVIVAQPTSPFRRPGLLTHALRYLEDNPDINSIVTMTQLHVNCDFIFTQQPSGQIGTLPNAPSQTALTPTGGLYVTRASALRKQMSLYAPPVAPLIVTPVEAIDIDTREDLDMAEALQPCFQKLQTQTA